jgi:hypothetical protein
MEAWAVGDSGRIIHLSAGAWSLYPSSPTGNYLLALSMVDADAYGQQHAAAQRYAEPNGDGLHYAHAERYAHAECNLYRDEYAHSAHDARLGVCL